MSWRYGVTVQKLPDGTDYYQIRELFRVENGGWNSWTENPIAPGGHTRKELIEDLELMLKDAKDFKAKRIPPDNLPKKEPNHD